MCTQSSRKETTDEKQVGNTEEPLSWSKPPGRRELLLGLEETRTGLPPFIWKHPHTVKQARSELSRVAQEQQHLGVSRVWVKHSRLKVSYVSCQNRQLVGQGWSPNPYLRSQSPLISKHCFLNSLNMLFLPMNERNTVIRCLATFAEEYRTKESQEKWTGLLGAPYYPTLSQKGRELFLWHLSKAASYLPACLKLTEWSFSGRRGQENERWENRGTQLQIFSELSECFWHDYAELCHKTQCFGTHSLTQKDWERKKVQSKPIFLIYHNPKSSFL